MRWHDYCTKTPCVSDNRGSLVHFGSEDTQDKRFGLRQSQDAQRVARSKRCIEFVKNWPDVDRVWLLLADVSWGWTPSAQLTSVEALLIYYVVSWGQLTRIPWWRINNETHNERRDLGACNHLTRIRQCQFVMELNILLLEVIFSTDCSAVRYGAVCTIRYVRVYLECYSGAKMKTRKIYFWEFRNIQTMITYFHPRNKYFKNIISIYNIV
jgi:hypothetical protein